MPYIAILTRENTREAELERYRYADVVEVTQDPAPISFIGTPILLWQCEKASLALSQADRLRSGLHGAILRDSMEEIREVIADWQ